MFCENKVSKTSPVKHITGFRFRVICYYVTFVNTYFESWRGGGGGGGGEGGWSRMIMMATKRRRDGISRAVSAEVVSFRLILGSA